jgi:MinD-like ATPase involved in chromosome partitioning or flagellar assembly
VSGGARPSVERRIIPISSGKGGVGKTTLAVNYALCLARHGRTVLIDLDTGTSSVRNCVDIKVERDLYHFFKKGHALADCITTLDARLDPHGLYRDFGFIASPKHLIEDITNFAPSRREQLIEAINALPANFVVLDLKAGLDVNVIEFLPYSNSGVLVFTPHLPAATLAAADIVKAILFRKLRTVFAPGSSVYSDLKGLTPVFVNDLLDRVEDVYDSAMPNLDAFVADLHHALGDHPVFKLVASAVDTFVVYYVLNRFDGVRASYDSAVRPFVQSLAEHVSAHMTVMNLGWVVESERINASNIQRVPAMLQPAAAASRKSAAPPPDRVQSELARLASQHLPTRPRTDRARTPLAAAVAPSPSRYLDVQLDTLRRMYADMKDASYRDNFTYITARSLHVMAGRRTSDFGDTRLFKAGEYREAIHTRGR